MKLSEKERLMLVEKKDEIRKLTNEISDNVHTKPDAVFIKNKINSILSLLSIISSYSDSKSHNLDEFVRYTMMLNISVQDYNSSHRWHTVATRLDLWCNMVNSIRFNLTDKKAFINIRNFDLNVLKQSLSGLKTGIELDTI